MLANMIGTVGISITLIKSLYSFIAGRLIFGVCEGMLQTTIPSFLAMSMPSELMVIFGPFIGIMINAGIFAASCLSYIVPQDETDPGYMTTDVWRIIFAFPIIFQVVQILGLLFVVRYDFDNLEAFYRDRHANPNVYREMVNKIYRTEGGDNDDRIDAFMEKMFDARA